MAYLTIEQINSNPIYAPIDYKEEFKRRLFLDNFQRCMTIRTFQKTAGKVIREKLNTHPIAKIMKPHIDDWQEENAIYNDYHKISFYKHICVYTAQRKPILRYTVEKSTYPYYKELLSNKKGKIVQTRKDRLQRIIHFYEYCKSISKFLDIGSIIDYGYYNFINLFSDWIKNPRKTDNCIKEVIEDDGLRDVIVFSNTVYRIWNVNDVRNLFDDIRGDIN